MKVLLLIFALAATLVSCASMYDNERGIQTIRSQRQADAYNATVSSESEKLVCTRERLLGSNIPQFYCLTVAQRDRLSLQARENVDQIGRVQTTAQ